MTKCDFDLCIYNYDAQCILDNIRISGAGYCDDCIVPTIPDRILNKYKQKVLDDLDKRDYGD